MRTATAADLGGDTGRMLRELRILEDAHRQTGRVLDRLRAVEVRWHRRRLRKLLEPR